LARQFVSDHASNRDERGGPMTAKSFHQLIARLGERAGMPE
jgi:hypothetical protein